jgi:hypothetical protein
MPASQAGRHGFESRLPLQEINSLQTSSTLWSVYMIADFVRVDRRWRVSTQPLTACRRSDSRPGLPKLIDNKFAISPKAIHQARMRAAHYEKVGPFHTNRRELWRDVPSSRVVLGKRRQPLRRESRLQIFVAARFSRLNF